MPKKKIRNASNSPASKPGTGNGLNSPQGCECIQPYIGPANWKDGNASVIVNWMLRFTFYDPIRAPKGKAINWEGMNSHTVLATRQAAAQQLLQQT